MRAGTPGAMYPGMLNLVSIVIGIILLPITIFALLPIIGLLNWLIVPLALLGAGIGALSSRTGGRNLNLLVLVVAVVRLLIFPA